MGLFHFFRACFRFFIVCAAVFFWPSPVYARDNDCALYYRIYICDSKGYIEATKAEMLLNYQNDAINTPNLRKASKEIQEEWTKISGKLASRYASYSHFAIIDIESVGLSIVQFFHSFRNDETDVVGTLELDEYTADSETEGTIKGMLHLKNMNITSADRDELSTFAQRLVMLRMMNETQRDLLKIKLSRSKVYISSNDKTTDAEITEDGNIIISSRLESGPSIARRIVFLHEAAHLLLSSKQMLRWSIYMAHESPSSKRARGPSLFGSTTEPEDANELYDSHADIDMMAYKNIDIAMATERHYRDILSRLSHGQSINSTGEFQARLSALESCEKLASRRHISPFSSLSKRNANHTLFVSLSAISISPDIERCLKASSYLGSINNYGASSIVRDRIDSFFPHGLRKSLFEVFLNLKKRN